VDGVSENYLPVVVGVAVVGDHVLRLLYDQAKTHPLLAA
jgi:hypothetical protein